MKTLTILGSTGSIGTTTLNVVRLDPERYRVFGLVAGQNVEALVPQILEFHPDVAVVATDEARANLIIGLTEAGFAKSSWPQIGVGPSARVESATDPEVDFVMSSIVGVAGLEATYEAVRLGKRVALANKEVLVACGEIIMSAAKAAGTELIPVDSEHNGAHQCLKAGRRSEVSRLILTASGGPFRETPRQTLATVTPEQALKHPTWKMGRRITIDSATLMNKGFEVIEACWLFGFTPAEVEVVVHPQSSVHALIEYHDGSVIAQASATDMRMPIQYALSYPERLPVPAPRLSWSDRRVWEFYPPDYEKFPLLKVAYDAYKAGGSSACTMNAADEVAVGAFLNGFVSFPTIAEVVEETLSRIPVRRPSSVEEILGIDRESRALASQLLAKRATSRSAAFSLVST